MSATKPRITITKRSAITAVVTVAVVIAWLIAVYFPQTKKLSTLDTQKTTLQSTLAADQARIRQLRAEAQHVTEIRAIYNTLQGYVPATGQVYTYIHTISSAAKAAGVKITSLAPSTPTAVTGTSYSAIPISAAVKGTYDNLLAFIKGLYNLPRLTDVNAVSITGGGPNTNRTAVLAVTLQLAIFSSKKGGTP
jgi:type IV pilus assembly protein PilO